MFLRFLVALVVVAGTVGCSSMTVNTDYDREARFDEYKTYTYFERDPNTAMTLLEKRIRTAVDAQMAEKGFTLDEQDPDILVAYQTGTKDRTTVSGSNYGTWWGSRYGNVDVYQYEEGNLVLDFVDATEKQLVWRGTAKAVMGDPSGQAAKINEAVGKMLAKYPPR